MDWSTTNVNNDRSSYSWTVEMYVRTTWNSRVSIRQWSTVYVRQVCLVLLQKWYTSCVSNNLPPMVKWARRESNADYNGIRKMDEGNLQLKLSRVILNHRSTPQSTTGKSQAELLMNRQLISCLNLLQPSLAQRVEKNKCTKRTITTSMHKTDLLRSERKCMDRGGWKVVVTLRGPVSALVELTDGSSVRRHFDQMRKQQQETHICFYCTLWLSTRELPAFRQWWTCWQ